MRYRTQGNGTIKRGRNRHAKIRAEDRYDVHLSRNDLRALARQIREETAVFEYRVSGTKTVWKVMHEGQPLFAMYHRKTQQIITFLKPEWVEAEKNGTTWEARPGGEQPTGTEEGQRDGAV